MIHLLATMTLNATRCEVFYVEPCQASYKIQSLRQPWGKTRFLVSIRIPSTKEESADTLWLKESDIEHNRYIKSGSYPKRSGK